MTTTTYRCTTDEGAARTIKGTSIEDITPVIEDWIQDGDYSRETVNVTVTWDGGSEIVTVRTAAR